MYRLAKIGFSQSYTYFTWRNTKRGTDRYLTRADDDGAARISSARISSSTRRISTRCSCRTPAGRLPDPRRAGGHAVGAVGRL